MNSHDADSNDRSLLAIEFTKRITQLSLSRRELVKRTGLSRQTLHNIERESRVDLKPATLRALDQGLHWRPGTALALSQGDLSGLDQADGLANAERESAYRWRIVERIGKMSLGELERLVATMESEAFGITRELSTDEVIARVERNVLERLEQRTINVGIDQSDGQGR